MGTLYDKDRKLFLDHFEKEIKPLLEKKCKGKKVLKTSVFGLCAASFMAGGLRARLDEEKGENFYKLEMALEETLRRIHGIEEYRHNRIFNRETIEQEEIEK